MSLSTELTPTNLKNIIKRMYPKHCPTKEILDIISMFDCLETSINIYDDIASERITLDEAIIRGTWFVPGERMIIHFDHLGTKDLIYRFHSDVFWYCQDHKGNEFAFDKDLIEMVEFKNFDMAARREQIRTSVIFGELSTDKNGHG